jgi:hypothetical protein
MMRPTPPKIAMALIAALLLMPAPAKATPGYARQAGLACEACHTVFPELTPFGRQFKLNAYTFSNVRQLQDINDKRESTLALSELAPLSIQVQASNTTLGHSIPDQGVANDLSQKNDAQFPQALSLFYTGKIADNFGAFLQLTWTPNNNSVGIDNSELRFADHAAIPAMGVPDFIYGITVNNNPTVQDVWNSTPAWGFPFIASNVTVPFAKTLIDGGLAQESAGLGAYIWAWNHFYLEGTAYRSAQTNFTNGKTGGPGPLDSTAANPRISGVAPYWRAAWEQDFDRHSITFGTFGLLADTHPTGIGEHGPTDRFLDLALDTQYQYIGDVNIFSVLATFIHEKRDFNATVAANPSSHLDTARITGSYFYDRKYGGSVEFFSTTGTTDAVLFAPASVTGSNTGKPDTQGATIELDYLPWLNTKIGVQYTAYGKFNGSSTNYDGFGRSAADNNTLFIFVWAAF